MLRACLFSTRRCRQDPEAILAGVQTLARWAGSDDLSAGTRLRRRFVRAMASAEIDVQVGRHSQARRLVKTLKIAWPASWADALAADRVAPMDGVDRVYLLNGEVWSRRKAADRLRASRAKAAQDRSDHPSTDQKADLLNALPANGFRDLARQADKVLSGTAQIQDPAERVHVQLTLGAVAEQPVPLWRPCGRSARLRSVGSSFAHLPSELRQELGEGRMVEFDLSACQLAVCARLWGVPEVLDLLESGGSFWLVLLRDLSLPAEAKGGLKRGTYAVCFGGSAKKVTEILKEELGPVLGEETAGQVARAYLAHRLVRALLKSRKRQLAQIRQDGGGVTVDGLPLKVRKSESKRLPDGRWVTAKRGRRPHQVLAALAQAAEQHITSAAYELAAQHRDELRIMCDLADGFSVQFKRDADRWERRLVEAVDARALELGIPTRLVRKAAEPAPQVADPMEAASAARPAPQAVRTYTADEHRIEAARFLEGWRAGSEARRSAAQNPPSIEVASSLNLSISTCSH